MSKLNTNTNGYTILFLVIMVFVVGGALATVSSLAKPIIDANIELDNKSKILKSVEYAGTDVLADYKTTIKAIAVDYDGNVVDGVDGYDVEVKKEYKKEKEDRVYPVYIYTKAGKKNYIVPLIGLGLWDEVNGYAAFNDDLKTLKGVAFDHVGETPGLGSLITEDQFQDQFKGITVFSKDGDLKLKIYKAGKSPNGDSDVDGLAGATLTTEGMDNMMRDCIPNYTNYFNSIKK